MAKTIHETIESLHRALCDYIEATYHIGDPALIEQRKKLLQQIGVTRQIPFLESTPRYQSGCTFSEIEELPAGALAAYQTLSVASDGCPQVLHDPAYSHQVDAIRLSLVEERNLVIMTGTGSGKTESFLLPILGQLAREASTSPESFAVPAMRALILYPMNALVNDQLGRLRAIFGDPRLVGQFTAWSGRPARFARYTSRTPYAGVRTAKKDPRKLKSFEDFYVDTERTAHDADSEHQVEAAQLLSELKKRGKWPAKPSLTDWYGRKGARWQDKNQEFTRAVTLPGDAELLTRHEVQENPPDLLVTNYSMLEYMLMRPIERDIFDATSRWLRDNPNEKFLVVLDEAHLYRGAPGAEVGLLLRRFRDRLGVGVDRLKFICATASFSDRDYAPEFGAQLSGASAESFVPITGLLKLAPVASTGSSSDAAALAAVDLDGFYAQAPTQRAAAVESFLKHRGVSTTTNAEADLYEALRSFGVMGMLTNTTMREATPLSQLGGLLFPSVSQDVGDRAVTSLLALGSVARPSPEAPGLLPCRIHNFFRGLPGLWACMDPSCTAISEPSHRSSACGRLYAQPRERCECEAQVLQLFTCRNCGTAYGRAYSDDIENPNSLWSEPGRQLRFASGEVEPLLPIDLLLEQPREVDEVEEAYYDLETGRLNSPTQGPRMRSVFLRKNRFSAAVGDDGEQDTRREARGQFAPCGACKTYAASSRSPVQDHQTKGDQPFQTLVARQLQVQPPNQAGNWAFAPLRGRKVLVFSDSRQVAARLAPNLQMYSTRDSLRPMLIWGLQKLQSVPAIARKLSLDDVYLAVLLASCALPVRLRPETMAGESFDAMRIVERAVHEEDALNDSTALVGLCTELRSERPPVALLDDIYKTVQDLHLGLEALALASLAERADKSSALAKALENIDGIAETDEHKLALARAWLRCWSRRRLGFWLNAMPTSWWMRPTSTGTSIRGQKGKFSAMERVIPDRAARKKFDTKWLPVLMKEFTSAQDGTYRLEGRNLRLLLEGSWVTCRTCKSVHRPISTIHHCLDCGSTDVQALEPDADAIFVARKGYYRRPVLEALCAPPIAPLALIAAEHTAQLNAPQSEDVFSKAEENELLFQDVDLSWKSEGTKSTAIDVLSSTTTMEVGIDIGALSGVALRNMPPGRANYQQRAGRAGRRGNAVATVVAFGSADSHDEHYFSKPDSMIRGAVVDPRLTLNNVEVARRHIRAFLLQTYHQARVPTSVGAAHHSLFSVLGTVAAFRLPESRLNIHDFEIWLAENHEVLEARVRSWLPTELGSEAIGELVHTMAADCLKEVQLAIEPSADERAPEPADDDDEDDEADNAETPTEVEDEKPAQLGRVDTLLDRLLYCGILPRYAFPTDVATFAVFDIARSSEFRHVMRFAPSQSLPIALSQYAPGKEVWISGKCYISGAIYSPMRNERYEAFKHRRLYRECSVCGFAHTLDLAQGVEVRSVADCSACGSEGTFGPARFWLRPPGFAHPIDVPEVTSPDDMPETSYATRAKLTIETPPDSGNWFHVNDRLRVLPTRQHLLVSNTGPDRDGYTYCVKCGRIEASSSPTPTLFSPHAKPFPAGADSTCDGTFAFRHFVLGTDFITDVALVSLRLSEPLRLRPGTYPTQVALRTVSEALAKAAGIMLNIEPGEVLAEFRPAVTKDSTGRDGLEAEIFLYDTLPGGAGFSTLVAQDTHRLFEIALDVLKSCAEGCEASCYRCLRSFKNKIEHAMLDRHVGIELLEHLLNGTIPEFSPLRLQKAIHLLSCDLARQTDGTETFAVNTQLTRKNGEPFAIHIFAQSESGKRVGVLISAPLVDEEEIVADTLDELEDGQLDSIVVVSELVVRGNLAAASLMVIEEMKGSRSGKAIEDNDAPDIHWIDMPAT
ncbi:DUF1998 domain-containing protein [Pelomonas sp. P7]|uniref:DUF1998 domain-containing protein n=1 Tax=Pelomonas caseinilytica TaxID=2906763 RepID=A0ABS8XFN2_9BURK|nr:DEAD/DEAH box helicase [Pelomonas sp. P7]MCE4538520.1 DUF1998 domain-containing protein [Pelomonas sp. P7]